MVTGLDNLPISAEIVEKHNISTEEYDKIVTILGRHPNINELGMFSVMWSEHCSYKSSRSLLDTLPTCGEYVICGPGENAGVVSIDDSTYIVFKVESHNHPTAVEPYQGAATGVGGILRDIFTMGARPIANLNSLRFGDLSNSRNRYLFSNAVAGIANYGNCTGVPTVGGECWFDESYNLNPLVNALTAGVIYNKKIMKAAASGPGNPVIYVGSATGRDGLAGAAFASRELAEKTHVDRPAVQVGDPFAGKLLIESCLEAFETGYVLAAQDMGAAGITCSVAEMADKGDCGIIFDLDMIPARGENLSTYEFLLSESQERMLLVVKSGKEDEVINIFKKWGLKAVKAGMVTNEKKIIIKHKNEIVVDLPSDSLASNVPCKKLPFSVSSYVNPLTRQDYSSISDLKQKHIEKTLVQLLQSPNICSKEWVFNQYDRQVQNNSILESSSNSAAVIRLRNKDRTLTNKAIAISMDCNARYCYLDPYRGATLAVAEAARNVACIGAKPIAITNNLNFASPENPEIFWQLKEAVRGIKDACEYFNTPVTGGNVSLYNESGGLPIYPAPVIGMLGILEDVSNAMKPFFNNSGDLIILVGATKNELGGSEYLKVLHNIVAGTPPEVNLQQEYSIHQFCVEVAKERLLSSCTDISEGGVLVAISESCFGNLKGALLNSEIISLTERLDASLFSESAGRLIISLNPRNLTTIESRLQSLKLSYNILGIVQEKYIEIENTPLKISVDKAKQLWKNSLNNLMTD